jgi:hypothetical protein
MNGYDFHAEELYKWVVGFFKLQRHHRTQFYQNKVPVILNKHDVKLICKSNLADTSGSSWS